MAPELSSSERDKRREECGETEGLQDGGSAR